MKREFLFGLLFGSILAVFLSHHYLYDDIGIYKVNDTKIAYHKNAPTYGLSFAYNNSLIELLEEKKYEVAKRICYSILIGVSLDDAKERLKTLEEGKNKEEVRKAIEEAEELIRNLKGKKPYKKVSYDNEN